MPTGHPTRRSSASASRETGNDRFKRGFNSWFWIALILATLLHAGLFFASPTFAIDDHSTTPDATAILDLPDKIDIPQPPEPLRRPARPLIADQPVDPELTMPRTTFDENPVEELLPPPAREDRSMESAPEFTPYTVRPGLQNQREVARALQRYYPPVLRDAGIGGTVNVWFFINEEGRVLETRIRQSSGYDAFDRAALQVASLMRFSPALNRDRKVPVWVAMDVTFQPRE